MNNNHSARVSNLDYLTEMSNGNGEFIGEMIRIFLVEMPSEIGNLEDGILRQDHETIKQAAHKLKSTIPFVGLDKIISKELTEMEQLASAHADIKSIEPLFNKVKLMCEKAARELQED